jgi:phosphoribosylformylglycinamidine synthase
MFATGKPFPIEVIELSEGSPLDVLKSYNKKQGLALDLLEMEYLVEAYKKVGRVRALSSFLLL